MAARNLVVIGASAGGLPAVATILSGLPTTLPAAVVIVVHTRSRAGVLPRLLARRSGFAVELAFDQAEIRPGVAYVAPADRHVVVTPRALRVVQGPRENGFRPAIDPLFRTAARARGAAVIGVILSGALDDGSFGLHAIVQRGGAAIVQDPDDAEMSSMPLAALRQTRVDAVAAGGADRRPRSGACARTRQKTRSLPRRHSDSPSRSVPPLPSASSTWRR